MGEGDGAGREQEKRGSGWERSWRGKGRELEGRELEGSGGYLDRREAELKGRRAKRGEVRRGDLGNRAEGYGTCMSG